MFGIIGLALVFIGIIVLIFGSIAPLLRLYFGDKSVITQIIWGSLIFILGAIILLMNAIHMS
ncbi:hypothetical protein GHU05_05490 [Fructobacillus tropaeoli]|uniref:hypothetical protein n=1 Tax=Fructobacillus tropaeoli TaxID=709323 RepID=UPI00145622D7|nr:hypothetical protein [Fructobacillus tropaeoli]NLS38379.1 hypothetical protein [Fructobacillus tropaeoli]